MGNGELADDLMESKDPSQMCLKNLGPVENTVKIPVPEAVATMGPSTPDAERENGDFPSSDSKASPTMVKLIKIKPLHLSCFGSTDLRNDNDASSACTDQASSPRTPKDSVFDPFAATPDHMPFVPFAPLLKNHYNDHVVPVTRRLQFDSFTRNTEDDEKWVSEDELCDVLTESLLEAVVLKQTESVLSQFSTHESDTSGCKTPPLAQYISGVAQTCPGAPIKPSGKSRNIDLVLCRKLEF